MGRAKIAELLCAAPGAAAVLLQRDGHALTPLARAHKRGHDVCAAVLSANGATE